MKKLWRLSRSGTVWTAALAFSLATLLAPPAARASSHREAPLISADPEADNTDVYFFLDPVHVAPEHRPRELPDRHEPERLLHVQGREDPGPLSQPERGLENRPRRRPD